MSEVIEHAVDLIEHTLLVLVLDAKLIAVGLADGTGFVRPGVPDVGGDWTLLDFFCQIQRSSSTALLRYVRRRVRMGNSFWRS